MYISKSFIVLVNYKSWKDTIECLESIYKLSYKNIQILIIDNSPSNESIENITKWANGSIETIYTSFKELVYPLEQKPLEYKFLKEKDLLKKVYSEKLLIIKALHNSGFSAANNIGLKYINKVANKEDSVWLLNNDTVVSKNALTNLIQRFDEIQNCGILGSKLIEYNSPDTIQAIGGNYNSWLGKITMVGQNLPITEECNNVKFDYPIGASMFIKVNYLKQVGLMEEKYFLYFEEYDWVLRGKKKGYQASIAFDSVVYHKGGGSSGGTSSQLADFYGIRSKILFTKKFFPLKLPLLYISFTFFIINRIKRKQYNRITQLFKIVKNPNIQYDERNNK